MDTANHQQTERDAHRLKASREELIERIDRGQGVCVVTYQHDKPDGIYFAGYSFD